MVDQKDDINIDDNTSVESLVSLIKEQTKELKVTKKKLEKLEEKFIKTNTDLKNIVKDKQNIENFFRAIFPKDMHDGFIKNDFGLYDTAELNKLWLIFESKHQSEFNKILEQVKKENSGLSEKVKSLTLEMNAKNTELNSFKSKTDQYNNFMENFNEISKKVENLENEKKYLLEVISQKDDELRNFSSLELEMAEMKAKALLEDLDTGSITKSYDKKEVNTNTSTAAQVNAATMPEKIKISKYKYP
jgi:hypothetical protein